MSTEIKPGQTWAWKPGARFRPAGTEVLVTKVTDDRVYYEYPDKSSAPQERMHGSFLASMEFVRDATPAPLDPSKVRKVDTVTLENGETSVRGPVVNIEHRQEIVVGFAIKNIGWRYVAPNVVVQQEEGAWLLTAHQPAPEPEPEWKPGTVALISTGSEPDVMASRLYDGAAPWRSLSGYAHWTDEQINSVRPLVVIDPAEVDVVEIAKAMHQVDYPGLDFALNLGQSVYVAKARAALAHLGIEVAR